MTVTSNKPDLGAGPYQQVSAWARWAPLAVITCGAFVSILDSMCRS